MISPPDLLRRTAQTLRERIGPAVDEPFARTQAFMAAVVLEKLAGQLDAEVDDATVADVERRALVDTLDGRSAVLGPALDRLRADGSERAWSGLVTAVYAARDDLGDGFDEVLAVVRGALRGRLDRALVYAR